MTTLFYIADEQRDLFVRADDRTEAMKEWRKYYDIEDGEKPYRMDEIPTTPRRGAIPWKIIPCVWIDHKAKRAKRATT